MQWLSSALAQQPHACKLHAGSGTPRCKTHCQAADPIIVTAVPFYDNAGTEDGSMAMEELCLLLRLATHVVADPGEGETPLMPLAMAHASSASAAAGQVSHACSPFLKPLRMCV